MRHVNAARPEATETRGFTKPQRSPCHWPQVPEPGLDSVFVNQQKKITWAPVEDIFILLSDTGVPIVGRQRRLTQQGVYRMTHHSCHLTPSKTEVGENSQRIDCAACLRKTTKISILKEAGGKHCWPDSAQTRKPTKNSLGEHRLRSLFGLSNKDLFTG